MMVGVAPTASVRNRYIKIWGSTEPKAKPKTKEKASPQLKRWSRARSIRSGRKLEQRSVVLMESPVRIEEGEESLSQGEEEERRAGKSIYMVSDGTGWTAGHAVNAALGQFDYCLVDRGCPVNTHLFSGVSSSFHPLLL